MHAYELVGVTHWETEAGGRAACGHLTNVWCGPGCFPSGVQHVS